MEGVKHYIKMRKEENSLNGLKTNENTQAAQEEVL